MSIIKSIKQVLGLGPAAENHFWDGSVPNQLSLKRGTPDAPGAELIKALNGVLSFPNQGQSLAANGYVKLPGGLIIQWGTVPASGSGNITTTYPIQFPTARLSIVVTPIANDSNMRSYQITTSSASDFTVSRLYSPGNALALPAGEGFHWIAIGY